MTKVAAFFLLLAAAGLPILETWKALLLALGVLVLVFSERRPGVWRLCAAAAVVLVVVGLKTALPAADIAEAHNAFLVLKEREPLERGLPPEIFRSWKEQFDAIYPPDEEPYEARSQWRGAGVPKTLFTQSADAIWRTAKFTRQVDAIDFDNLAEFRGGFANEIQYNFWAGELLRESMPFYVMYELTAASVGSRFAWQGQVFWERADGGFEEVAHRELAAQEILPGDVGKRVYAAFFPKRNSVLQFRLEPSLALRLSGWTEALLTLAGSIAVVVLSVRLRWRSYLCALSIFSAAWLLMMAFIAISAGKFLGRAYPPQGGGDDGLVHEGWGRLMAMVAGQGNVVQALQGAEPVYWFTPGTRYVRMLEKLVFGDTNHLFALLLACVPVVLFYLLRHLAGRRAAWVTTLAFLMLPAGSPSYLQYIANAKLGYGEFVACGLFLLGLALMMHNQRWWGGTERNLAEVAAAGTALAAAMFIRPNFAIAVIWVGAAHAWASWRRRDLGSIAALAVGLGTALWMPFHNWYYGGEFYFISGSGTSYALSLRPADYLSALRDVMGGRLHTEGVTVTSRQLAGWLWNPGFVVRPELRAVAWALHAIKLLALGITCWVAVRWLVGRRATSNTAVAVIAVAALCAHAPMLFTYTTHYRYAMLGWDLSVIVLIVWAVGDRRLGDARERHGTPSDCQSEGNGTLAMGHAG